MDLVEFGMAYRGNGLTDMLLFEEKGYTPGRDPGYSTGQKKYNEFIPKLGYDKLLIKGTGGSFDPSYLEISSIKLYK